MPAIIQSDYKNLDMHVCNISFPAKYLEGIEGRIGAVHKLYWQFKWVEAIMVPGRYNHLFANHFIIVANYEIIEYESDTDFFHGNYQQMPPDFEEYTAQFANEYLAQEQDQFWSYSGSAFNILGHLVQSVSGQPFNDYVEEKILAPQEMEHSSFECRPDIEARLSKDYSGKEQNLPIA